MQQPVLETNLAKLPVRRGKVRDIYDLGRELLLVSTDRISAFDWILPTGIPEKGHVLTQLSAFWFKLLGEPNHLLSTDLGELELPAGVDRSQLAGRSMLVRKTSVVPIECVSVDRCHSSEVQCSMKGLKATIRNSELAATHRTWRLCRQTSSSRHPCLSQ